MTKQANSRFFCNKNRIDSFLNRINNENNYPLTTISHSCSPFFLHRLTAVRIVLLAIFLLMAPHQALAQKRKVMNRPYVDQRQLHYGFFAGVHLQDIELVNNGFVDENGNNWYADAPNYEPGFSVGVLAEYRLNTNFSLRVIPSMHFGSKDIRFVNHLNGEEELQNVKSTYISMPIDLKVAGERFNNYRPYAVVGVNPMFDLTVKKQKNLLLNRFDCYLEAGFGCDFYGPYFKFIPEIKFAYGLSNIINKKRNDLTNPEQLIFTNSIDKGRSKMIIITFYFE